MKGSWLNTANGNNAVVEVVVEEKGCLTVKIRSNSRQHTCNLEKVFALEKDLR